MARRGTYDYGSVEKESNTQPQGRSGGGTMKKPGPAAGGVLGTNKTSGGGINRATKPTSQR